MTDVFKMGHAVSSENLGEGWLKLVELTLQQGEISYDEKRKRLALQSVRVQSKSCDQDDVIIWKYGIQKNLEAMLKLTFQETEMYDVDVKKSFSPGAKSYFQRIQEGKMLEFVIKRLSLIPESKKAVIVFPTYEDYAAVLENPTDDYLPCIVSVQFRLLETSKGYSLTTIFYARSMDIYQKGNGNLISMAKLSKIVAAEVSKNLKKEVVVGPMDGLIADMHIYDELLSAAQETVKKFHSEKA